MNKQWSGDWMVVEKENRLFCFLETLQRSSVRKKSLNFNCESVIATNWLSSNSLKLKQNKIVLFANSVLRLKA